MIGVNVKGVCRAKSWSRFTTKTWAGYTDERPEPSTPFQRAVPSRPIAEDQHQRKLLKFLQTPLEVGLWQASLHLTCILNTLAAAFPIERLVDLGVSESYHCP